jgi:chaperone required for assembly of F1-ATPase
MRELFEEVLGQSPLDPEEAVRQSPRVPQRKRFYATAAVASAPEGFAITLDDKPVRMPAPAPVAPTAELPKRWRRNGRRKGTSSIR